VCLPDQHVLGDLVELIGGLDGLPLGLDEPGVDDVQGSEVLPAGPAWCGRR
jgi:hypothetical protein